MIRVSDHHATASEVSLFSARCERLFRHAGFGTRRVAKIAAAAMFCIGVLTANGANAQALDLECSIGGQQFSASLNLDATNRIINTGKGIIPVQMSAQTITWYEDGVLRMIKRDTGAVFRRLPDGSFFQIGKCHPLER